MKSATVAVGQAAPDFTLPSTGGGERSLGELRGSKVVLLFYRGHWCGACRAHLDVVRDTWLTLSDAGAEVLAISSEPLEAARDGVRAHRLPFTVLSDHDLAVIDRYGVRHLGEPEGRAIARPSLFVIDPAGIVRFAHVGEFPRDRPSMDLVLLALEALDMA